MPKCTVEEYAARALKAADVFEYSDEYDDDSALCFLFRDGTTDGVLRHLVIGVEAAGDGPANRAEFFSLAADAKKRMAEYAKAGWASFRWDLADEGVHIKQERYPR